MKFLKIIAFIIVMICGHTVFAQSVVTEGVGMDKDSAVRDAVRNAVEKVIGSYVDSRTLVSNAELALDEIYTQSQGFVKNIVILHEKDNNKTYSVTANIEVDSEPDSKLMDKISMLMLLNDPRIAVVVLKDSITDYGYIEVDNDAVSETAINEKLLDLGFNHVIDISSLAKLNNSTFLNDIYNGETSLNGGSKEYPLDYLVIGKSSVDSNQVYLPNGDGSYSETMLTNSKASLKVKIVKFDTGELIGTFAVEGSGLEQNNTRAQNKALSVVSEKAAQKVAEKFKNFGAKATGNLQMIITASDYSLVKKVADILRVKSGIQGVHIREYANNKAVIDLDTVQKAHVIVELLRQDKNINVFVDAISNSKIELNVF